MENKDETQEIWKIRMMGSHKRPESQRQSPYGNKQVLGVSLVEGFDVDTQELGSPSSKYHLSESQGMLLGYWVL